MLVSVHRVKYVNLSHMKAVGEEDWRPKSSIKIQEILQESGKKLKLNKLKGVNEPTQPKSQEI